MKIKSITAAIAGIFGKMRDGAARVFRKEGMDFQLILYVVIIILINIVSVTLNFRCDLTRNNTYSLSEKSRGIVSNLKENLKIKVLFSRDLPAQHTSIYRYLIDLLEEYDYYGNEYFSYEIIDEKDLEKVSEDFGIRAVQSQEYVDDQIKVRRVYMGLVIQQSDLLEKIDAITKPEGLEYAITSRIEKMSGKIDGLLRLKEPITLSLYLTGDMIRLPVEGIGSLADDVKKAVDKCNINNYNKIEFKLVDPSKDPGASEAANLYGISMIQWGAGRDRFGQPIGAGTAPLGIVLKSGGRYEAIDLTIAPTLIGKNIIVGLDDLEDRVNEAIGSLVRANPKIGYITGHGEVDIDDQRSPQGGGLFKKILSDIYDIAVIDLTKEDIPEYIGMIIVNGPKSQLGEEELFRIDQYLMKGKSAIFFMDAFNEINLQGQQNMLGGQPLVLPVQTGLEEMLKHYGVTVNRDVVLDSSCARGVIGGMLKEFYFVPIIKDDGLSDQSVITKYLKGVAFVKAASVDADDDLVNRNRLDHLDLVSSSEESWLMTGQVSFNPFFMKPPQPEEMKAYPLAVQLAGRFDSFFSDRDAPSGEKSAGSISSVSRLDKTVRTGNTEIIVVGTAEITRQDFLSKSRGILPGSEQTDEEGAFPNAILLHNLVDYLAGNAYIPEMRGKSLDYNPLKKKSDIFKKVVRYANMYGIPALIVLIGLIIRRRRLKLRKRLQRDFAGEVRDE